jgi:pimeloyl-ACP methyl ester carboxylesterase
MIEESTILRPLDLPQRIVRARRLPPANTSTLPKAVQIVGKVAGVPVSILLLLVGTLGVAFTQPGHYIFVSLQVIGFAVGAAGWVSRRYANRLMALIVIGAIVVLASQLTVSTPAILDGQGKPLAGSIAGLEKVTLGDTDQWILIRGRSTKNPVLLYLAGGPGTSETGWLTKFHGALEKSFVIVNWEQPGAGKDDALVWGWRGVSQSLTPSLYLREGLELTNYLRHRFHQDKIYIVGHSWGTLLGVWMVQQRPDWFHAYVGVSQMVNPSLSDRLGYDDVLKRAQAEGNTSLVKQLKADGPTPYYDASFLFLTYMHYRTAQNHYMQADETSAGGKPYLPIRSTTSTTRSMAWLTSSPTLEG